MLRCTHLSFTIQSMAIISLVILKVHGTPLLIIPDEENEGKLGMVDIASMSKEAILTKMVLPDDTQQAKDTKSVIAQYIFSLAQQEALKTTAAPSTNEIFTDEISVETEAPEITTVIPVTLKVRSTRKKATTTTEMITTTEEPEYEEEVIEKIPTKAEQATDAIQDIINAAIFEAQAAEPTTTTTTTPPPTTAPMRRRRTRSTTMRNRRTTTDISDYYDEDTEKATTIRRRTYRPTRRTTRNPDSGVTGWVPEEDDEDHEVAKPTPASAGGSVNVLNDLTKLLVNVGNADVNGIVDQSLKIASVETVGSVISGVFNLFMCTPLDQLVGRCKMQRKGAKINH